MRHKLLILIIVVLLTLFVGVWLTGTVLTSPAPHAAGVAPDDLGAMPIDFQSRSGANIKGWFIRGKKEAGAIALMHGNRANRLSMVDRARFLSQAGFSVLLFDFQAHGESSGDHITFGYLESKDAQAAIDFLRANAPGERIGVIGMSMGGAATLLAEPPLEVDAMVLEMVYPTITEAIGNRLSARLGGWSRMLTPLLTLQLRPRLGIDADVLQPLDKVGKIAVPKLFVVGAEDRHTTLEESQRMFDAAAEPKELWIVERAGHVDAHAVEREEYERRVLSFFTIRLSKLSAATLGAGRSDNGLKRMYVLDCGRLTAKDQSRWTPGVNVGQARELSNNCYLLQHERGMLLWETGVPDSVVEQKGGVTSPNGAVVWFRDKTLVGQLETLGVKAADITYVAISHTHGDHVGNVKVFEKSKILIQKAEYDFVTPKPVDERQSVEMLSGDRDVFGDGSVTIVSTPGHTPGHQSLLVKLPKTGAIVLTGDLVHFQYMWDNKIVPSFNFNRDQSLASIERVAKLLSEHKAQLWIGHDKDLTSKLNRAPKFYE